MKNMKAVIAGMLCLAAAGANAQSFEQQIFQISRAASAASLRSRQAFTAPLAQMAAVQGQAAWTKVVSPDGTFTAEMPGTPAHTQATSPANGGRAAYTTDTFLVETGGSAYVIQSAIYPASVDCSNPKANLQGGLDNAAKNMAGGKWISVTWTTHQGLVAVDVVGMRNGHEIRNLSVMRGQQIFSLTSAGPEGTSRSDEANRFLASLRIR